MAQLARKLFVQQQGSSTKPFGQFILPRRLLPHSIKNTDWLRIVRRLQALAYTGLSFADSHYDLDRYEEVQALSLQMMANLTGEPVETLGALFGTARDYPTLKVDVRAVIFGEQ